MMFMLIRSLQVLCVVALLTAATWAEGVAPFVHPGLLNNLDELLFFKGKVEAGAEPWASAYRQRVAAGDYAALEFAPNAANCRQMVTETEALKENPCVNRMALDRQAAYSHALQWFVEQDRNASRAEQHARKAMQILNHWFGSDGIKSWTGSRKRYAGYLTASGVYAAEIIRHTYPGWSGAEIKQIEATLNVIWNFIKDGHPPTMNAHFSNQESSAVMGKLAIAIFLSDRQKFDDALAHYRRHLANNIYYRHATQPDFKNYETCRDLGHTQLSLSNLTASAEMAWKQGVDLYSLRDHGLLKSIEFQLRFILDEPDKPDAKCAGDPNPNTQGRVEVRDPKAFYEAAYHHYHDRLKLDADRLRRVIFGSYRGQAFRPENNPNISATKGTGVGFGWGTLTHAGLPAYPAGHRPPARAGAVLINDPLREKTGGEVRGKGEFAPGGGWRSRGGLIVLDAGHHIEHGYFEAKLREFIAPTPGVGKLHVFSAWETAGVYNQRDEQGSFWNWRIGDHYQPFKVFAAPRKEGRQELHVMWPELSKFNDGKTHTFRTVWSGGRVEYYIDGQLVRYFNPGRMRVRYFTLGNDTFDLKRAAAAPPIISDVKVVDLGPTGAAAALSLAGWKEERTNQPVAYFDKDGVIAIEAETFTSQLTPVALPAERQARWVSRTDVKGSGGAGYLTTQPAKLTGGGYQFGQGAYVTYEIEVKGPGKYYTGVRGYAADGGPGRTPGAHDSVFLTVNGHPVGRTSWKGSAFKDQWHWAFSDEDVQGVFPVYLPAGKTTVEMYVRELGTIIDQIILVRDKKLMPAGDAPLQIVTKGENAR